MKKTILSITTLSLLLIIFSGFTDGSYVKGKFNIERGIKTEVSLIELNPLKETTFKENLVSVSDSGFKFNLTINEPGLYGLYIKAGEGNSMTGLNNIIYIKPNTGISLEYYSGTGNTIICQLKDNKDKDNSTLITLNKRLYEMQKDNFLNPSKNEELVANYLNKFYLIGDSLLEEKALSHLVRKYIKFKISETYNSELFRSSLRDLSNFNIDYYKDDFILNFSSSIQNLIAYLNVKSGLNPYTGKKNLEIIAAQATELEKIVSNPGIFDRAVDYLLNSYVSRYRDTKNFEADKISFNLIAEKIHNKELSAEIINSFANLKYTIPGADLPPAELLNRDGTRLSLEKFKGKYILVDIWATWCVPCMKMIPHFQKLENDYSGKNIEFISICTSSKRDLWLEKLISLNLTHNQLFDIDREFSKMMNITAVPHFMIYDPKGKLFVYKALSPDNPELRKLLDELLK